MNERGVAAPVALMILVLLTSLMLAFATLSQTEPVIASNLMLRQQSQAMADSGVERALWALSTGDIPNPMAGNTAAAPYDGASNSFLLLGGLGGFVVKVENSLDAFGNPIPNERLITSVGWTPTNDSTDTRPKAITKVTLKATKVPWLDPPCALCAGGEAPTGDSTNVQVGGSASINASNTSGSPPATYCASVMPQAAVYTQGIVNTNGHPSLTAPSGGSATMTNVPRASFSGFTLTDDQMSMLKAKAMANGTYFQGAQNWTSPPPPGIVFVDTPSGNPLTNSSPSSDMFTVTIHGNWSSGWNGWLVVAGSIDVSGNTMITGLVYAQNDITLHGNSGGGITGAVISTNRVDTASTNVDSEDIGNMPVTYNCPAVRNGGGTISQNWFVKPGTYKQIAGQ
jgi:hypothetical protein